MDLAHHGQAELGLGVVDGVAAHGDPPTLGRRLTGALQHFEQHLGAELLGVPTDQVDSEDRAPAHGVDVAHRVGGGDAAPHPGVVVDGGDEVGGDHQGPVGIEPPDRGVVARRRTHE